MDIPSFTRWPELNFLIRRIRLFADGVVSAPTVDGRFGPRLDPKNTQVITVARAARDALFDYLDCTDRHPEVSYLDNEPGISVEMPSFDFDGRWIDGCIVIDGIGTIDWS
jgi:hypothetical protein